MWKNTVQANQWLDKCFSDSAPSETMVKRWYADFKLNVVAQMQMILNVQVGQIRQLSRKTPKTSTNSFWLIVNWSCIDSRRVDDIRRQYIYIFAWKFVNEKAVFQVGAMFAHSQSKTTTHRWFRVLFATVSMQKRSFCVNIWQWMKHGSTTSLRSQIGNQWSGQQQVKANQNDERCKHQQTRFWLSYFGTHKVFCSSITLRKEEPSIANII